MKRSFTQFCIVGVLLFRLVSLSSCANIVPPTGGDRDELPPRLVTTLPKDSAVNVSPKQIILTFDEFVTVDNYFTNLIVSPVLKNLPQVEGKLRNVTIKIKDTLEPNTTYAFDFGDAIRDVNESNIAKGLRYVFSTGSRIDVNTYSGKIVLAETGKVDSGMIVVLHKNLADSSVQKNQPRYFTRINGRGEFTFYNLPTGNFAVYALAKEAGMKTYTDSTLLFAFRNAPVTISADTRRDTLYAFAYKRESLPATIGNSIIKLPASTDRRLRYSADLDNGAQDLLGDLKLNFLRKLSVFDTTRIVLTDTGYLPLSGYTLSIDTNKTKITVQYPWKPGTGYRLLIAKEAVGDSTGTTLLRPDTIRFVTKKEADYGSVRIRFANLNLSKNPVLQLVQENTVVESFPLSRLEMYRKLYRPGSYDLRILYDANKNGVWDPGSFRYKRQPEIVLHIPRQFTIRANWDNEVVIAL